MNVTDIGSMMKYGSENDTMPSIPVRRRGFVEEIEDSSAITSDEETLQEGNSRWYYTPLETIAEFPSHSFKFESRKHKADSEGNKMKISSSMTLKQGEEQGLTDLLLVALNATRSPSLPKSKKSVTTSDEKSSSTASYHYSRAGLAHQTNPGVFRHQKTLAARFA